MWAKFCALRRRRFEDANLKYARKVSGFSRNGPHGRIVRIPIKTNPWLTMAQTYCFPDTRKFGLSNWLIRIKLPTQKIVKLTVRAFPVSFETARNVSLMIPRGGNLTLVNPFGKHNFLGFTPTPISGRHHRTSLLFYLSQYG